MNQVQNWPRVAVVGAGAVGSYFGGLMALAGAPAVMIGRQAFVDALKEQGLFLDTLHFQRRVQVEASVELSAVRSADLVLFCVKATDNSETARAFAPFLTPNAIVVSLQNGVDNVEQIREAAGIDVLPAVVYIAVSMDKPGYVKHVSRGDLVLDGKSEKARVVAEMLRRAGIPCRLSDNIEGELWAKLLWNCALNAISALGQARYGQIAESGDARKLVRAVVEEVLAVVHAAKIVLPDVPDAEAAMAGAMNIATNAAPALSSTAQDINRGKRTEIDSLNGFITRRGTELGVPTPVNHALYTLVKLLEMR